MNDTTPTPSPAGADAAGSAPAAQTIEQHDTLSPAEQQIALADLKSVVAAGKLTPEQAARSFDELGVPMDQRTDTRTEAQKELDNADFAPAKPEDFDAVRIHDLNRDPTPDEHHAATLTRTWLAAAELPRELGDSLFTTAAQIARTIQPMTEAERGEWSGREWAKLERVYGPELKAKLEMAGRMINAIELKQPGLKHLLKSGIGDSARVASQLIAAAERYWMRRQR